jgi:hypothetical protein
MTNNRACSIKTAGSHFAEGFCLQHNQLHHPMVKAGSPIGSLIANVTVLSSGMAHFLDPSRVPAQQETMRY